MFSVIRFDLRAPGLDPPEAQRLYGAALEMSEWADRQGFDMLVLSEHHASADGYLPSPLVMGGAVAARTQRIPIWVSALLVPLHDPVRLAEDIAVLDLISNGRIAIVSGLGYRPVEYALFDREWKGRGKRLDECLEIMVRAWTGEPFEVDGETVQVTPRPVQQPHPMIMVGGSGPAAAKRAARFGFGFFPPIGDDDLAQLYLDECARLGKEPGWVGQPKGPGTLFVADDPERLWGAHRLPPPARRDDLQLVADPRHPVAREVGSDHRRRAARPKASTRSSRPSSAWRWRASWDRSGPTRTTRSAAPPLPSTAGRASSCSPTRCCPTYAPRRDHLPPTNGVRRDEQGRSRMALELSELVAAGHTALVTQECQGATMGAEAALPQLAEIAQRRAVPNIARLVAAARAAGVPVIHCVAMRRDDGQGSNHNARLFMGMLKTPVPLRPGTPAVEVVPEIGVADSDVVLSRLHGLGPMGGTDLDPVLRNLGVTTVVGVGCLGERRHPQLRDGRGQPRISVRAASRRGGRYPRELRRRRDRQHARAAGHDHHDRRRRRRVVGELATDLCGPTQLVVTG